MTIVPHKWVELNSLVMSTDDEDLLRRMIDAEMATNARNVFLLRIHARLNKVRAEREREQILAGEAWYGENSTSDNG